MSVEVKSENRKKTNFKEVIVWKYLIRMLFDVLTMIFIIMCGIIFAMFFHKYWELLTMQYGYGNIILISIGTIIFVLAGLYTNGMDIYTIASSNLLTKLRYIGDDPKLVFLTKKKE